MRWRASHSAPKVLRMLSATPTVRLYEPTPLNKVPDFLVLTALFCALAAAVVTLGSPSLPAFGRWLLITECIGLTCAGIGLLVGRIPWLQRRRPGVAHMYISAVAVPVGYLAGSSLAYTMLDEPIPFFESGPRRIIALLATALAGVFLVYLDAMRHRVAVEATARSEAQRLAAESQLRLLRAELEPHMLFNTLANLRSLVDVDPKLAQTMIDQIIIYLRSALAASREESTTLRNEFAQLRAYLEIMSLRMGPRLVYRLDLPDALQQVAIPPMLLQPLVENAIKHGLEPKIGQGEIEVKASQSAAGLEIAVTDSGLGLSAPEPRGPHSDGPAGGYGLAHVRERLQAFYGAGASLTLVPQQPVGVRAVVRIAQ